MPTIHWSFLKKGNSAKPLWDRTYYDLLRIYANELDKENTLLLVFGFSFADEHLRDITLRALKNPTLKLVIFAFNVDESKKFKAHFDGFYNVTIIHPVAGEVFGFDKLNSTLIDVIQHQEDLHASA